MVGSAVSVLSLPGACGYKAKSVLGGGVVEVALWCCCNYCSALLYRGNIRSL